jgi:class 3 adenylate cyclase
MSSPRTTSFTFDFSYPRDKVWAAIYNSDRLNRAMGLPAARYTYKPLPTGGSFRIGQFKRSGLDIRWREHPHEWIQDEYVRVQRDYFKGPLREMVVLRILEETPTGCRLTQTTTYCAAKPWLLPMVAFEIDHNVRKSFTRAFRHAEKFLSRHTSFPYEPVPADPIRPDTAKLQALRQKLESARISPEIAKLLSDWILTAQEPDLVRLRPFAMARRWKISRAQALEAFLQATRAGALTMSWDLICPRCRGAKLKSSTLAGLRDEAHCDACGIRYDAEFDRSVELTFNPHPTVRVVNEAEYCVGSPSNTSHYLMQIRLAPGQTKSFDFRLQNGPYLFRSLQSTRRFQINVSAQTDDPPPSMIPLVFETDSTPDLQIVETAYSETTTRFEATNRLAHELVLTLERSDADADACTAAYATSQQCFRDLFSSDVLRADQQIHVSSITLLFTDLKDSTALYRRIGDARAFALVNNHLSMLTHCVAINNGAVVKTIGDSVMAAFSTPADAVAAALAMQQSMKKEPKIPELGERLAIRVGIHAGPCFVVNSNERLDYFGSTVNLAARAQSESPGDGLLITGDVLDSPGVKKTLGSYGKTAELVDRVIKGFERERLALFTIR